MVFFVVMYALSQVSKSKFQAMSTSLSSALHTSAASPIRSPGIGGKKGTQPTTRLEKTPKPPVEQPTPPGAPAPVKLTPSLEDMKGKFQDLAKNLGLEKSITISASPSGKKLYVRLADSLLFGPGSADLGTTTASLMDKLGIIITEAAKPIRIEGHTDNVPIHNGRFESNWQLSTERAAQVINYLINKSRVPPELLSASGYSEYRPIAPNATPEDRAKNRRVEFVILDEEE